MRASRNSPVCDTVSIARSQAVRSFHRLLAAASPPVVDEAAAKEAQNKKEDALSRLRAKFTTSKAFKSAGADVAAKKTVADSTGPAAPEADKAQSATTPAAAATGSTAKRAAPEFNGKFYATEPAVTIISVIEPWVTTIHNIIVDSSGARSVDWNSILPPGTKDEKGREQNSEAQTVFYNLKRKKKEFQPDPKGLASQLTTRILAKTFEVVREILEGQKRQGRP
jgi:hypothetical protein